MIRTVLVQPHLHSGHSTQEIVRVTLWQLPALPSLDSDSLRKSEVSAVQVSQNPPRRHRCARRGLHRVLFLLIAQQDDHRAVFVDLLRLNGVLDTRPVFCRAARSP